MVDTGPGGRAASRPVREPSAAPSDLATRLTRSRAGRVVVVVTVAVGALWIVGPNTPPGPARDLLDGLWRPAVEVGLDQDWEVFSPNPASQSLEVYAEVDLADGSTVRWEAPERDVVLGAYSEYRWQKWQERVRLDARADLWDPTAAWIADQVRADGGDVVQVRLVRRWIDHRPLTAEGVDDGGWQSFTFHEWPS